MSGYEDQATTSELTNGEEDVNLGALLRARLCFGTQLRDRAAEAERLYPVTPLEVWKEDALHAQEEYANLVRLVRKHLSMV